MDRRVQVSLIQIQAAKIVDDARVVPGLRKQPRELTARLFSVPERKVADCKLIARTDTRRIQTQCPLEFVRRLIVPLLLHLAVPFSDVVFGFRRRLLGLSLLWKRVRR